MIKLPGMTTKFGDGCNDSLNRFQKWVRYYIYLLEYTKRRKQFEKCFPNRPATDRHNKREEILKEAMRTCI